MKTRAMLQLIILAIFVSSSTQQAQNPNCQPIKATKNYDKTLFVFVVESSGSLDNGIKYLMKQFACSIPETENVKVYIMDYTNDSSLPTVKEEDLSTSKQFVGKIYSSLTGPTNAKMICRRMETCQDNLLKQPSVKNYAVKYIMINDNCHQSQPDHWSNIELIYSSDTFCYKQDSGHDVFFKHGDVNAPQLLKDVTNKIIGTFLNHDSLWQTPDPCSSNNNDSDNDILFYIIIAILIGIILILVIYVIFKFRKRKSTNLKTDAEKEENTAKGTKRDSNDDKGKEKDNQAQKKEKSNKSDQPTSGEKELQRVLKQKDEEKRIKTPSTLSYSITLESEAPKKKNRKQSTKYIPKNRVCMK